MTDEHNRFLLDLRNSGVTNMWGATPYLMSEFGLSDKEAGEILVEWIASFKKGGVNA